MLSTNSASGAKSLFSTSLLLLLAPKNDEGTLNNGRTHRREKMKRREEILELLCEEHEVLKTGIQMTFQSQSHNNAEMLTIHMSINSEYASPNRLHHTNKSFWKRCPDL